jgi:hypothetical protein
MFGVLAGLIENVPPLRLDHDPVEGVDIDCIVTATPSQAV